MNRIALVGMLLGVACGGAQEEAISDESLIGGTAAGGLRPEVGRLWFDGGYCTATLIRQDIAITAAHCVNYHTGAERVGSIEFDGPNGSERAQMIAHRSFSGRLGPYDVALVRLESAVPTRLARAAEITTSGLKIGDELTLFGFGCGARGSLQSLGKTYRRVRYGSSTAVCPGDSGGPGFLANGTIATITSGYQTPGGADVFGLPSLLKNDIDAQLVAWGAAPTQSTSLLPNARVWRKDVTLSRCSEWTLAENFASGRFNAHQFRMTLPAGVTEVEVRARAGAWAPVLVLGSSSGTKLYDGGGFGSSSGVEARELSSGRTGAIASVRLQSSQVATLDVYLSSWAARESGYSSGLPTSAAYSIVVRNDCAAVPSGTRIDRFPYEVLADTRSGTNRNDRYACAPDTNESGPELTYELEVAERGFLATELSEMPAGVDADVHVLSANGSCLSRGDVTAAAMIEAGRYLVVVDSWVGRDGVARAGQFQLNVGFTSASTLEAHGMSTDVAVLALKVFGTAFAERAVDVPILTIADFARPSNEARLWVVDLSRQALVGRAHVAHGYGSSDPADRRRVRTVSNDGSNMTSIGVYVTGAATQGALAVSGIEPGFNDAAERRGIKVAVSDQVTASYVASHGAPVESNGTFLVGSDVGPELIEYISEGTLLLAYFPDSRWMTQSEYLR
ncbi:MAG: murein L,D-transpeptidase catalytic domain family protein [Deltaproteobacteria bacterium]|nr:murein L,D-transpeptidase catalytic domain family protein [Deltaproteobacteria bacterium]